MHIYIHIVTKLCVTLVTPWTVACQAPLSMGFSGQEYWSELPFPHPGDLPNAGIEPRSPALQANSLPLLLTMSYERSPYIELLIADELKSGSLKRWKFAKE